MIKTEFFISKGRDAEPIKVCEIEGILYDISCPTNKWVQIPELDDVYREKTIIRSSDKISKDGIIRKIIFNETR